MNKIYFLFVLILTFVVSPSFSQPPSVEVRAVWLTTNYGLDWPRNRLSHEQQKKELISILDNLKKWNFNTVLFQVRARGEVLYDSKIEPMSSLIVGNPGSKEKFDPLAFVIEECHQRGLECHAWVVTYPLGGDRHVRSLGKRSATKTNPNIVKKFGNEWYLDPGNPRTDDYLLSIVKEIVTNYDVDGIHFDYIRYPDNRGRFPDDDTFKKFGSGMKRDDWRRDNITRFVTKTYDWVKSEKPWVTVSSSPLGRYRALDRNGHGWTAYETVYQDAGKWMQLGKHDALFPMMYYKEHLFYPFVDDWIENGNNRILVPGLGPYQMIELGWSKQDIINQVDYVRKKPIHGQAYFRADNLLSNTKEIMNSLSEYYQFPAKLPALTWLSDEKPTEAIDLRAEKQDDGIFTLKWDEPKESNGNRVTYNVYRSENEELDINDGQNLIAVGLRDAHYEYIPEVNDKAYYYYVTVSDAYRNESNICYPAFFFHSELEK